MRVFLSYHTPDEAAAKALKQAIEANDSSIAVFFAPYNLKLGAFWLPMLGEAIAEAQAFIILIGRQLGEWQKLEYYEAIDRKAKEGKDSRSFPLVPVKLTDRAPNLPFLTQFHWIESAQPTAVEPLTRIVGALKGVDAGAVAEPWRTINPYRGLEALREEDSDFFFGRESKTAEVLDTIATKKGRLIALIGNSGVGKSSLVQAGVIGSLKRQRWPGNEGLPWLALLADSRAWSYISMKPGAQPVRALARAFTGLWFEDPTDPTRLQRTDEWEARLKQNGSLAELLDATDGRFRQMGVEPPRRILLYIDQGEEIYSRASKEETRRFSEILSGGLGNERLIVMTSLRSDYYGYLQANETLFPLTERIDVPPLATHELEVVLREPAQRLGVGFETEGLVEHIVRSAQGQPGALPLLADVMTELWKRMQERGDRTLRITDQKDIILVGHALARRADRFLDQHVSEQQAVRDLFTLKLVSIPFEGEPVRRRTYRTQCTDQEWRLIEMLAEPEWRILVTSQSEGIPSAEVAHEVILTKWETLRRWLADEREFLIWKGGVERSEQEWKKSPFYFKRDALLSGDSLFQAKRWMKTKRNYLFEDTQRFVKKSLRRKRPGFILGILAGITVVLVVTMTIVMGPFWAESAELMRTDPEAATQLWWQPENFWRVSIFFATMITIPIMILIFFFIVLKWLLYAGLRFRRERRDARAVKTASAVAVQ